MGDHDENMQPVIKHGLSLNKSDGRESRDPTKRSDLINRYIKVKLLMSARVTGSACERRPLVNGPINLVLDVQFDRIISHARSASVPRDNVSVSRDITNYLGHWAHSCFYQHQYSDGRVTQAMKTVWLYSATQVTDETAGRPQRMTLKMIDVYRDAIRSTNYLK